MNILFIDDNPIEVKILSKKLGNKTTIHWMPNIAKAKLLLAAAIHEFHLIILDVVGTSYSDSIEKDAESLNHPNVLITSGVMVPISSRFKFSLKENLADAVNKEFP